MIRHIGTLEGDFQREHGIDLSRSLGRDGLSWRRFRHLVAGLSPDSGWAHLARQAKSTGVEDGMAALRAMAAAQ